jgi:hypothetical protein
MRFSTWRMLPLLVALLTLIGVNQVGATREFGGVTTMKQQATPETVIPNFYKFKPAGKSRY